MPRLLSKPFAAAIVMTSRVIGRVGSKPARLLADEDRFTPCSRAPHCVSSQAPRDSDKYVAPLAFAGTPAQARAVLRAVLAGFENARIEQAEQRFVHATFHSTLGFVDDVTFLIREDAAIIDVKSASRLGYYDFGVNRRRVESLRTAFDAQASQGATTARA